MTFDLEQHIQDVRAALAVWPNTDNLSSLLQNAVAVAEELTFARQVIDDMRNREGRQLEYIRVLQARVKAAESGVPNGTVGTIKEG